MTTPQPHLDPLPVLPVARDGIYPHCVWCRGENYVLAVLPYSNRECPCAASISCGRMLPENYVGADGVA